MSDLVIQVLVRKLSNINRRHIYVQMSATNNWKLAAKDIVLPKPDESFVQASGTKAQVLALLNHTELQRYKPRLKERRLCPFVPFIYIATQQGSCYSQPSGKYHSQG